MAGNRDDRLASERGGSTRSDPLGVVRVSSKLAPDCESLPARERCEVPKETVPMEGDCESLPVRERCEVPTEGNRNLYIGAVSIRGGERGPSETLPAGVGQNCGNYATKNL